MITFNGDKFKHFPDTSSNAAKLQDLVKSLSNQIVIINTETSRYGDCIATIKDLNEGANLKVDMPERLRDKHHLGIVYDYNGKGSSNNCFGNMHHDLLWFKCKQ